MTEPIILKFKLTENEYAAAQMFYEKRANRFNFDIVMVLLLIGIGIFRLSVAPRHDDYFFILAGLVALVIIGGRPTFFARIAYRRNPKVKDESCIAFSEKGIEFKTTDIDSKLNWTLYNRLFENGDFFLLGYGRGTFTIIPKRAFASNQQEDAFRTLVVKRINAK